MLILSNLVLLPTVVRADGYSGAVYSPNAGTADRDGSSWNYATGASISSGNDVSCKGTMTATFTYNGATLPQSVIVMQSASASAGSLRQGSTGGTPTAACSDGLGDTCSITPAYPQNPPGSEGMSGSASKTKYTVQSGTSPLTLTCPAMASASLPMTQQTSTDASVSYNAQVFPVTISIGGATSDGQGGQAILVGQLCAPTLGGGPAGGSYSNWSWTVSDTGNTFQSWNDAVTPPVEMDGTGNLSIASPSWYWKNLGPKSTTETISCTATYTAPDGTTLSVKAMQQVTVYVPDWSATYTKTGEIRVDTHCPNFTDMRIYAGPLAGQAGGMNWGLIVSTPQTPVAFGSGNIQLVQIITTNRGYYDNSATPPAKPQQGQHHISVDNTHTGLDTQYPYTSASGVRATVGQSDSPSIALSSMIYSVSMMDKFTDYLMYKPPVPASAPNSTVMWVTVAQFGWSTNANATIPSPSADWTKYTGNPGSVKDTNGINFIANNTYPTWTATYSGDDDYKLAP